MRIDLKSARKHRMMSQERLSRTAGVSRTTISHIETNPDAVTTTRTLRKLARAMGMQVSDFFAEDI